MKKTAKILGIVLLFLAFLGTFFLNRNTRNGKDISFSSVYKEKTVTLKGTYWGSEGAEYAVLICPGYSCDREKWRPFADLFHANGMAVLAFDYAGQGASSSTIGFDNAKTDAIPEEIDDALEVLHGLSGVPYERIIAVGHSMGGRSLLRLLYDYNNPEAETRTEKKPLGTMLLMSPEVNYEYNAQASLFAGTSDASEEPWKSYGEANTKGTDVYLIGSTADDIVKEEDVLRIFEHLGGKNAPEEGMWIGSTMNGVGSKISVTNTNRVLHSYMMFSPRVAKIVNGYVEEITGRESVYSPWMFRLVYFVWYASLLGLGFLFYGYKEKKEVGSQEGLTLLDAKSFLLHKLLLWLPGLVVAFLICCLCVVMPFGSPVMNTPYMCCIAGYGLVMAFSYRKGNFKGTKGKLPKLTFGLEVKKEDRLSLVLVVLGTCFVVWYVLWGTMYRLIPLNWRLFWVSFAAILMTVGYYVAGAETEMLERAGVSKLVVLLYNLIQYVALFLLVLFYLVIKSYSGLIGQVQNMILMYVFCIPLGSFVLRRTGNRIVGALVSAFLFQTLMITSAALIAIF